MKQRETSEWEKQIDPEKYQVFLFTCPAHVPLNGFAHPWFVVNKKGAVSRWEVRFQKKNTEPKHLYHNMLPPFQGIEVFSFSKKRHWTPTLVGVLEGGENSLAHKAAEYIEASQAAYPYRNRYFLFGPNSDTYAEWILNAFPEWKVSLPRNTVGKNYGHTKKIRTGVIHGRFQPPHNGHIRYIISAFEKADHLLIGICTPKICTEEEAEKTGYPCTAKLNPFTYDERAEMIRLTLDEAGVPRERYTCIPFPSDYVGLEQILPKDAVFLMSVTGEGDKKKIAYIESLGFKTKTIVSIAGAAPRERSGAVRDSARNGSGSTAAWEDMVPRPIAEYMKAKGLLERL